MIQILGLREVSPGKKTEKFFEYGMRAASVEAMFNDPESILEGKLHPSERFNLYYTIADCLEEPGRKLDQQFHIPFDVDGIDIPDVEQQLHFETIARVVCDAIGVEYSKVAILYSGNGLQFIVGVTEPIKDVEYFDKYCVYYRAICDRIDLRLIQAGLKGKADSSVWSSARLMRFPNTENRKPGKTTRHGFVLQHNIERGDFSLKKASGLPELGAADAISPQALIGYPTPDAKQIMQDCKVLNWAQTHPDMVSEELWYGALSIIGKFPNGRKMCHQFSKDHPKYTFEETEMKISQAVETSGPRTCKNMNKISNGKCAGCKFEGKITSPINIEGPDHIKTETTGFHSIHFDKNTGETRRGKPDVQGLVKYYQRQHNFKACKDVVWRWNGKFYEEVPTNYLESYALKHFDPYANKQLRLEFVNLMRVTNLAEPEWFTKSTEGRMNFQNGVFDIRTGQFMPHSMEFGFMSVLTCDYDKDAIAPRFKEFIRQITTDRDELSAELQEFMGYAFANENCRYQKMLLLLGDGNNGKSTLVNVIHALAGKGASSLSLKDLQNPQNRAMLEGKIVNIAEENSNDAFRDTELIKNIATGGKINIKRLYVQPYDITTKTKIIALCNVMPRSNDTTRGFFRRFLIIPFDAQFSHELKNIDPDIEDKLLAELPGIFNWIMEGYLRLNSQKKFTHSDISEAVLETFKQDTDPIHAWFAEGWAVVQDSKVQVLQNDMYLDYTQWCDASGIKNPSDKRKVLAFVRKKIQSRLGIKPLEKKVTVGHGRQMAICNLTNDTRESF